MPDYSPSDDVLSKYRDVVARIDSIERVAAATLADETQALQARKEFRDKLSMIGGEARRFYEGFSLDAEAVKLSGGVGGSEADRRQRAFLDLLSRSLDECSLLAKRRFGAAAVDAEGAKIPFEEAERTLKLMRSETLPAAADIQAFAFMREFAARLAGLADDSRREKDAKLERDLTAVKVRAFVERARGAVNPELLFKAKLKLERAFASGAAVVPGSDAPDRALAVSGGDAALSLRYAESGVVVRLDYARDSVEGGYSGEVSGSARSGSDESAFSFRDPSLGTAVRSTTAAGAGVADAESAFASFLAKYDLAAPRAKALRALADGTISARAAPGTSAESLSKALDDIL